MSDQTQKRGLLYRLFDGMPTEPRLFAGTLLGTFAIAGIFGFVYETLFYVLNDGYISRRGDSFGPWIGLYGLGSLLILLLCWRLRKKPWQVFLASALSTGVLELGVGWVLYEVFHMRAWDYNTEKWNWGNIGGYVCFRSVMVFALSGLLLIYVVVPLLIRLSRHMKPGAFFAVFGTLGILFAADIVYNMIFVNIFKLPGALEFWYNSGLYGEHVSGIDFILRNKGQ